MMRLLPTGFCLFLVFVQGGHGMTNSLDRFNDEDISEFGEEPQKREDRGLLLDKIFNKKRMMPGNVGGSSMTNSFVRNDGSQYGGGSFNIMRGDDIWTGLNYGGANQWGSGMGSVSSSNFGSSLGQPVMYGGPYAGPPMFIQPAPPPTTPTSKGAAAGGGETTTAAPDAGGTGGTTTMKPADKAEALVKAFGGGERPRIQQMGPPIIVPIGTVPGLNGVGKLANHRQVVKPGEQMPMYGRIVLGPAKWAQSVDMNRRTETGRYNQGTGGLTLVRFNKPAGGVNYSYGNGRTDSIGMGGGEEHQVNGMSGAGGFRSIEPYEPPQQQRQRVPPVIKYVPVVEIVKRKRMKAVLADPI